MFFKKSVTLFSIATFLLTATYADDKNNCAIKYKKNIVEYADEHNPGHLLVLDYKKMKLLDKINVPGSVNHHADPMGTTKSANYVMVIPKGSNYVNVLDIKSGNYVKKIRLPFRPRSADAYNAKYNLVLLNSRDRAAAVLIDATSLKIVGKAGFNNRCNFTQATPLPLNQLYADSENFNPNFKCLPVDFGGDQISGHPLWVSSEEFIILDRANRVIHLYKIDKEGDRFYTRLVQAIKTDTSLHQVIPEDKNNPNNRVFYGSTEGNVAQGKPAMVYKFILKEGLLKVIKSTKLSLDDIQGFAGHNLYITPDLRYLYAPSGARAKEANVWIEGEWKYVMEKGYKWYWNWWSYSWVKYPFEYYVWKWIPGHWDNTVKTLTGGVFVIDTKSMRVVADVEAGKGAGHVAFSEDKGVAIVTNHKDTFLTAIDYTTHTFIKNIPLNYQRAGIFSLTQSHMQHIDEDGEYYYGFWSDGGVFFRVDLDDLEVDKSVKTGGIPIQGNWYKKVAINCDIPAPAVEDGFDELFSQPEYNGAFGAYSVMDSEKAAQIANKTTIEYIEKDSNENPADTNDYDK